MLVSLVGTGGTIASLSDAVGNLAPALKADDLRLWLPDELRRRVVAEDFAVLPGPAMAPQGMATLSRRLASLSRERTDGAIVVTHGTDTLEETAYFLALTLPPGCPVVLTGAQREASLPGTDGPRNLTDAIHVALTPQAAAYGVLVVFGGEIHEAQAVCKTDTRGLQGFSSGPAGPAGLVRDRAAVFLRPPTRLPRFEPDPMCEHVEIVTAYAGMRPVLVEALLDAGVDGLIVQAFGTGNLSPAMFDALKIILSRHIPVVITSRVPFGAVAPLYGYEGGGAALAKAGAILAGALHAFKARILLMLALAQAAPGSLPELFADP